MKMVKKLLKLLFFLITLIYMIPGWIVLVNSLKREVDANMLSVALPSKIQYENYINLFKTVNLIRPMFNGLVLGIITVSLSVIFASMAAFVISRIGSKITSTVYYVFLGGLVVPGAAIPTYIVLKTFHILNTYQGLIAVFLAGAMPITVFLYSGFVKGIPRELDEAAVIDGCGRLRLFFQIIFPLLKPVTSTVIVFNFINVWNAVDAFLYFAPAKMWAMPMTVYNFYGNYMHSWNMIFADILVTILPIIIIYVFAQKFIVAGMTAGAVKG